MIYYLHENPSWCTAIVEIVLNRNISQDDMRLLLEYYLSDEDVITAALMNYRNTSLARRVDELQPKFISRWHGSSIIISSLVNDYPLNPDSTSLLEAAVAFDGTAEQFKRFSMYIDSEKYFDYIS